MNKTLLIGLIASMVLIKGLNAAVTCWNQNGMRVCGTVEEYQEYKVKAAAVRSLFGEATLNKLSKGLGGTYHLQNKVIYQGTHSNNNSSQSSISKYDVADNYKHAQVVNIDQTDFLAVRIKPTSKSRKVDEVYFKTMVAVVGHKAKWYKILYDCCAAGDDGCNENDTCKSGWVYGKYLDFGPTFL